MSRLRILSLLVLLAGCSSESSPGAPSDSGASDTAVEETASDAADAPDAERSFCDPARGPTTPVGTTDLEYTAWSTSLCRSSKEAFCATPPPASLPRLLACDAVETGYAWAFGSTAIRVVGRKDGECVIDFTVEVEGAGVVRRCRLPLPMSPWAGLSKLPTGEALDGPLEGIEDRCEELDRCSLLGGAPEYCMDRSPRPPLCEDFATRSTK